MIFFFFQLLKVCEFVVFITKPLWVFISKMNIRVVFKKKLNFCYKIFIAGKKIFPLAKQFPHFQPLWETPWNALSESSFQHSLQIILIRKLWNYRWFLWIKALTLLDHHLLMWKVAQACDHYRPMFGLLTELHTTYTSLPLSLTKQYKYL